LPLARPCLRLLGRTARKRRRAAGQHRTLLRKLPALRLPRPAGSAAAHLALGSHRRLPAATWVTCAYPTWRRRGQRRTCRGLAPIVPRARQARPLPRPPGTLAGSQRCLHCRPLGRAQTLDLLGGWRRLCRPCQPSTPLLPVPPPVRGLCKRHRPVPHTRQCAARPRARRALGPPGRLHTPRHQAPCCTPAALRPPAGLCWTPVGSRWAWGRARRRRLRRRPPRRARASARTQSLRAAERASRARPGSARSPLLTVLCNATGRKVAEVCAADRSASAWGMPLSYICVLHARCSLVAARRCQQLGVGVDAKVGASVRTTLYCHHAAAALAQSAGIPPL